MFSFDARSSFTPSDVDALTAFIGEHTGLSTEVIQLVLDANDAYWDEMVSRHGMTRMMHWAQGGEPLVDDDDDLMWDE